MWSISLKTESDGPLYHKSWQLLILLMTVKTVLTELLRLALNGNAKPFTTDCLWCGWTTIVPELGPGKATCWSCTDAWLKLTISFPANTANDTGAGSASMPLELLEPEKIPQIYDGLHKHFRLQIIYFVVIFFTQYNRSDKQEQAIISV